MVLLALHTPAPEALMSHFKLYPILAIVLLLILLCTIASFGQTSTTHTPGLTTNAVLSQKDSATGNRLANVAEMAKRVDSLQFIVVYNAELLRNDLDAKMMLIYVMLGVIVVACVLMYLLLSQSQRQRKELEEKVFAQLSASAADFEAKMKIIQAGLSPPKKIAPKKKGK